MSAPRGFSSQAGLAGLRHGQYVTLTPQHVAGMVPREDEQATVTALPAREAWLRLLDAVDATPTRHDCPGIGECGGHPRWTVSSIPLDQRADDEPWGVCAPGTSHTGRWFPTHAEAIRHATDLARPRCQWCGDRLTWLDTGTWQGDTHDQCPASQDGPADDHGTVAHVPRPADLAALRWTR